MSEEIIKVLDNLAQRFGIVIDWTSKNIIPYLEDLASRYIAYNNLIAIVQIVISVVLIILGIICIIKLVKWKNGEDYDNSYCSDDPMMLGLGITGASMLIVLGISLIIGNTIGIVQNVYMPELTILEYIRNLT